MAEFDETACEAIPGAVVTTYNGFPACAIPSTRGRTAYFALGSGMPLGTPELVSPLLVAGVALATFMLLRSGRRT